MGLSKSGPLKKIRPTHFWKTDSELIRISQLGPLVSGMSWNEVMESDSVTQTS